MNQHANQSYSGSLSSVFSEPVALVSPITQTMNTLVATQSSVHDALNMLEQRMGAVLRPVPPPGETKPGVRDCGQSPLHEDLISCAEQAAAIDTRIHAIAKRLTV